MKMLVICSGGIDSVAMAAMNVRNARLKDELILMTFNYGQKGIRELNAVYKVAERLYAKVIMVDISSLGFIFGKDQQLSGDVEIEDNYSPSVVVPLRNAVFLQIAMVYAYAHGLDKVILGSHLDDITEVDGERLYPDCSPEFFKAFELAMDLGTFRRQKRVRVESASILGITKVDLIKRGYLVLGSLMFETWSCYYSGEKHCGVCESCRNRKKAFAEARVEDKTQYEK